MDTLHFRESEFECPCCGDGNPSPHLIAVLELVRNHFNKRVFINSGYRCKAHNQDVGGAVHSKHRYNIAADIEVEDVPASEVQEFLLTTFPYSYGIGSYSTFTHIDVREERVRWNG